MIAPVVTPCANGLHYFRNVGRERPVWRCAGCGATPEPVNPNPRGTGGRCLELTAEGEPCTWTSDAGVFRMFTAQHDEHRAAEHGG